MAIENSPAVSREEFGLLPHELIFVEQALVVAQARQKEASLAVGEAVNDSGGDWAFDDPGTQAAVQEAGREDDAVRKLTALMRIARTVNGHLDYPAEDSPWVAPGSRITIATSRFEDVYDVMTRRIPGMPVDNAHDIAHLSAQSPMGQAVIGRRAGSEVSWRGTDGRSFEGEIATINQTAQKLFYERLFHGHVVKAKK